MSESPNGFLVFPFLEFFILILHVRSAPLEARRRGQIPWSWSYGWLWIPKWVTPSSLHSTPTPCLDLHIISQCNYTEISLREAEEWKGKAHQSRSHLQIHRWNVLVAWCSSHKRSHGQPWRRLPVDTAEGAPEGEQVFSLFSNKLFRLISHGDPLH